MNDKYIIKNCPATGAGCCGDTCPEITDCPLKQIVELCKGRIHKYINKAYFKYEDEKILNGEAIMARLIIGLLDIEDFENVSTT